MIDMQLIPQVNEQFVLPSFLAYFYVGLSFQSQALLADMRDDIPQDQAFSMGDNTTALHEDDTLQWETIPDDLQEDETFVHAVRDIVGSQ